jgi:hypothetical protein
MAFGDVRVIGEVAGTHVLEDIGRDVPQGVVVTIPGELAIRSRDLYRAIAQKYIRCLNSTEFSRYSAQQQLPSIKKPPSPPPPSYPQTKELEDQVRILAVQAQQLKAENVALKTALQQASQTQDQKLDSILVAIRNISLSDRSIDGFEKVLKEEVAELAPVFIPSKIRPDAVSIRVDIQGENSQSDISETLSQLRKLKKEL